jgi:hypothetical protein
MQNLSVPWQGAIRNKASLPQQESCCCVGAARKRSRLVESFSGHAASEGPSETTSQDHVASPGPPEDHSDADEGPSKHRQRTESAFSDSHIPTVEVRALTDATPPTQAAGCL